MNHRKIAIYVFTAVLTAAAALFALFELEETGPFFFAARTAAGTEEIRIRERSDGEYVVFLPSYVRLEKLQIRTVLPVSFGDVTLSDGMTCEDLKMNRTYGLSGMGASGTITLLQSENIPAMHIDTVSGSMDNVQNDQDNREAGRLRLYTADGTQAAEGFLDYIKARGNTTYLYSRKKAYSIKLASDQDLLGMGAAEKWILLANAFDPTHMRNKIVYDFAAAAGLPYSPESRWVDLYLNGEYAGLYLLTERNEVHPQRVALTGRGSFLVSAEHADRLAEIPHVKTDSGISLRIHSSALGEQALQTLWQSAENAIMAQDGIDPVTGSHWSELIDLDSWARKYLIEEIFANHDGGRLSQFFYRNGDGRICAGPVWDYDYAMANRDIYETPVPNMFYVNQPDDRHGSLWFGRLYQDPAFYSYVTEIYEQEFLPLLTELTTQGVEQYAQEIAQAAWMDHLLWDTESPSEETETLRTYLEERTAFLNKIWVEDQAYVTVSADRQGIFANYILAPGDILPDLPQREDCSWYITGTDTPFDNTMPIYEDMGIELRPD